MNKDIIELFTELRRLNAHISLQGDNLKLDIPKGLLTDELKNTIREHKEAIVEFLSNRNRDEWIPKAPESAGYPASFAQKRLWLLSQLSEENNRSFNMSGFRELGTDINEAAFVAAFEAIIQRHDNLRTVFQPNDGDPTQKIQAFEDCGFTFNRIDYTAEANASGKLTRLLDEMRTQVFDLEKGPLIRAGLVKLPENGFVFYYCMHHIISDGWSVDILLNELMQNYQVLQAGKPLQKEPLRIQYRDYAVWQLEKEKGGVFQQHKDYWTTKLQKERSLLLLPGHKKRPEIAQRHGHSLAMYLDRETSSKFKAYCSAQQGSLFIGVLAVWNILVNRYTSLDDIIIGTPVAGREHPDLEGQIGLYVNTVVLRSAVDAQQSFNTIIAAAREELFQSYEHQEYPFDRLLEDLGIIRDIRHNPIFDVMLVFQNASDATGLSAEGQETGKVMDLGQAITKFDLDVTFSEAGDQLYFGIVYDIDIYDETIIRQLMGHFNLLLKGLLDAPEKPVGTIDFLTESERTALLDFGAGKNSYAVHETVVDLFNRSVVQYPRKTAAEYGKTSLSYASLGEVTDELAVFLSEKHGIRRGDIVAVTMERGLENLVTIIGVLKAGACCAPIDPETPAARKELMTQDAALVIDDACYLNFMHNRKSVSGKQPQNLPTVDDLAYIVYTSGSTGAPKGVLLKHDGIANHLTGKLHMLRMGEDSSLVHASKMFFVGAIWQLWTPLATGSTLYLTSTEALQDISQLLLKTAEKGVRLLEIIPSQLNEAFTPENEPLIARLEQLILTGEKYNPNYVNKVLTLNPAMELYNTYGSSECSDVTTYMQFPGPVTDEKVLIGKPADNFHIYILNDEGVLCPMGVLGEMYTAGIGVGPGYINNPELTAERFIDHPLAGNGKLYKTGDLGRWLPNGEIEILGRKDNQLNIRGQRIEPGEIEQVLLIHPDIENAVVLLHENAEGEKELTGFIIANSELTSSALRSYLKGYLSINMIPSAFIQVQEFPLMPNGKIDKKTLASGNYAYIPSGIEYSEATTSEEIRLTGLWKTVLEKEKVGLYDDFFELGGHSLKATRLSALIHKEFGVKISMRELFLNPTINQQIGLLQRGEKALFTTIPSLGEQDIYELSPAQRRFWVLSRISGSNRAYNTNVVAEMEGNLDLDKLHQAFQGLVNRHEALRTVFQRDNQDNLGQRILSNVAADIDFCDLSGEADPVNAAISVVSEDASIVFDLQSGPLFKIRLFKIAAGRHILAYTMHHIVCDGWSIHVLIAELMHIYNALEHNTEPALPEMRIQYKDYAKWQNDQLKTVNQLSHKDYWMNRLEDQPAALLLPEDFPRPPYKTQSGDRVRITFPSEVSKQLAKLSQEHNGTLFTGLLAALKTLLFYYSRQEDIVVGTPIAGREHVDLENQIGCYINTLALRTKFSHADSFSSLLSRISSETLEAYEHQIYPFDDLVEQLSFVKDLSRSELFDVMIVLQNAGAKTVGESLPGSLAVRPFDVDTGKESKVDLTFTFFESDELVLNIVYNTDIYTHQTVERMAERFGKILSLVTELPTTQLDRIDLLTADEKQTILLDYNDTFLQVDQQETVLTRFTRQAAHYPDHTAIAFGETAVSYAQLEALSNSLAHFLVERHGISKGAITGILLPKTEWQVIAILAIMKSGAAYLPLNINDPLERREGILADSGCKLVLDQSVLDEFISLGEQFDHLTAPAVNLPEDLAYVIYTSGSTGKPKGVMVEHAQLNNYLGWFLETYAITSDDHTLLLSNIVFDGVNTSLFGALSSGATLYIVPEEILPDAKALAALVVNAGIRYLKITPTQLNIMVRDAEALETLTNAALRLIVVGGEPINAGDIRTIQLKNAEIVIVNHYGPTETTIGCIAGIVTPGSKRITIGKPIANTSIYILNEAGNPVPEGAIGELTIGGAGVTRGYLNQPEFTAEKFIQNPFGEGRLYRSGDMARWLPGGEIDFLGRKDDQVKIRGYRVELPEIEYALNQHPSVSGAAVMLANGGITGDSLMAYLIAGEELSLTEFKNYLRKQIPGYMIPDQFFKVDAFPVTVNGKVDKRKLLNSAHSNFTGEIEYNGPETEVEKALTEIWSMILEKEEISVTANFFDLGANSLKIIYASEKINERLQRTDSVALLFQYPSIREYSAYIEQLATTNQLSDESIAHAADELESAVMLFNGLNDDENEQ